MEITSLLMYLGRKKILKDLNWKIEKKKKLIHIYIVN